MSEHTTPHCRALPGRRRFLGAGAGALGFALGGMPGCVFSSSWPPRTRRVAVMADLHIGNSGSTSGGRDGSEWFRDAIADLVNVGDVAYALTLGDIAHNGLTGEFEQYLAARGRGGISEWHECAGNHEYWSPDGINEFRRLVCPRLCYGVIDSGIAWFLVSDEGADGNQGEISDRTCDWLIRMIEEHRADNNIIVCSHHLVAGTVRGSDEPDRILYPVERVAEIIATGSVDLWLCGHKHHAPWAPVDVLTGGRTAFINVASLSYAYNTEESQSFIFDFEDGAQTVTARRRVHDRETFATELTIPLSHPVRLADQSRRVIISPD